MIFDLSKTRSIANIYVSELRDEGLQRDRMRFRRNMERIGECFAFEISRKLAYQETETKTPLGISPSLALSEQPILATILRAGLPLHQGLLNIFDQADSAFIAAYRKNRTNGKLEIKMEYSAAPDLTDRILIIADPMLATGLSMVMCCKELIAKYKVRELHIVSVIASAEGLSHVRANFPKAQIWLGAIDEEMTSKAYIVPGLGDAGDLAYGAKV